MKRTSFDDWDCSIARTVDVIGEVWTPLIIRDLFWGIDKFDALLDDLGISRNILSDRLKTLSRAGIVEKVVYEERPLRHRYRLTAKGVELWPIIAAMVAWGDKWVFGGPEEGPVRLRHTACEKTFVAQTSCSACGEPVGPSDVRFSRVTPAAEPDSPAA